MLIEPEMFYSRKRNWPVPGTEDDPLWLLFDWEFRHLLDGQKLENRYTGEYLIKGRDEFNLDMELNGFMVYGVRESWFSE